MFFEKRKTKKFDILTLIVEVEDNKFVQVTCWNESFYGFINIVSCLETDKVRKNIF